MEVTHISALIFLSSLLGCILLLLIINKIASKYLNGDFYKTSDSPIDTDEVDQSPIEIKIAKIKEEIERSKQEKLSISETRLSAKSSDDGTSTEERASLKVPLRVKLTFEYKKSRVIGNVMSIEGLTEMGKCPHEISFQAKLVPMKKKCKGKTIWKSTKNTSFALAFTFGPLKPNVDPSSNISVKMYGRKKGFRSKAVCIGQSSVPLSSVKEAEGVLTVWRELVPRSIGPEQSPDSSDFEFL